ncbi:MAG: ATP synthase F1 subunit epsilon [Candidatus Kerfeldbacteria bacterium]|nr:ATP synthase F1 subunit epsilon [Candidatus Kerfeldbacteria bacterium]
MATTTATQQPMQLRLVTPVETLFDHAVKQVVVPTDVGQITVLPHHTYLVSIVAPGELVVTDEAGKTFPVAVAGGVLEVFDNTVLVLADSAEHAEKIDLEAAEAEAAALAKQLEAKETVDMAGYAALQQQLAWHEARIALSKKWRKK